MRTFLSLMAIGIAATAPAAAGDVPGKTSVAVRASTLGLGVEVAHTLPVANLTGRLAWNGYTYETSDTIEGNPYDVELDLGSVTALVDWRPWGTVTHFTGGLVFNSNEIGATGQATATYEIGGVTYPAADVGNLSGRATFADDVVPYAGIGWNVPLAPKTALSIELGIVFQGSPKLSLEADGLLATDPDFMAELEAERAEFEQDIEDYKYYPVAGIGIRRRF